MNPSIYTAPLADKAVDDFSRSDGVLETFPALDLDLPDTHIIQTLNGRIENSIGYWNDLTGFNLHDQRIKNLKAFKGDPVRQNQLYYNENEWVDNEVYVGVDAILSYTTAEDSHPEVYPASDEGIDKKYATDLEKYEQAHSKKFHLAKKTEIAVFNLLTQHLGAIGMRWDPNYGKNGEIVPFTINPAHLIIDKNAKLGENPAFICWVLKDSVEGLVARFPEKEQDILRLFGIKRKGPQNISREIAYREVWFTYYDSDSKPCEAVAWYVNKLVLDKKKNPNWLYKGEGENFLDNPIKPFVFINLINDGEHMVDLTGPLAQAIPMQMTLNSEGEQISDNLQTANGSRVINAEVMTADQMEAWDDQPNQTVAATVPAGKSLEDVIMQLPPHTVSNELIADKLDSRNTVHGILGTPSQFRGDDTDQTKTASEASMIKNQASGRQDKIIRAIDAAMEDYFNLLTQMMTVYYTEEHNRTINGGDGHFDHIMMHRDKISSGMTVSVQAGTTLQFDKARQEAVAQNAAELGYLAPYDYFRLMHMDNPQKLYDNLVKYQKDPQSLAMDLGNQDEDTDAIEDFTVLMDGGDPELREDATFEYIEQMRKQLISDKYFKASSKIRNKIITFINKTLDSVEVRDEIDKLTQPEEEEETAPLPQAVQQTIPPQPMQPGMNPTQMPGVQPQMPMGMPMPPMGQPQPMMPPMQPQNQPMPQPMPQQAPGIQGVLQNAQQPMPVQQPPVQPSAPNLNPSQPMPPQSVGSLPPM